ncbi:MAG: hypothetical protein Q9160_008538 [Pyrenula sp. 1 TL-2023]
MPYKLPEADEYDCDQLGGSTIMLPKPRQADSPKRQWVSEFDENIDCDEFKSDYEVSESSSSPTSEGREIDAPEETSSTTSPQESSSLEGNVNKKGAFEAEEHRHDDDMMFAMDPVNYGDVVASDREGGSRFRLFRFLR